MEEGNEGDADLLKGWTGGLAGGAAMGRPYSTDLRERVLRACEVGEESQAAIARRFEGTDKLTWGYCGVAVLRKAVSDVNRIGRINDPHGGQP